MGSVDAGTQVTLLSAEDNGYFKIRDDKDREGWVEAKFVTENAGIQQQFQALSNDMTLMQDIRQTKLNYLSYKSKIKPSQSKMTLMTNPSAKTQLNLSATLNKQPVQKKNVSYLPMAAQLHLLVYC